VIDKTISTFDAAVADIPDGATIHVGGFVGPGYTPSYLIAALARQGASRLTIVTTAMGVGAQRQRQYNQEVRSLMRIPDDFFGVGLLVELHRVAKGITTFPAGTRGGVESPFEQLLRGGEAEVELLGQGSLAERIRCARAGIAGFYTPVGVGTVVAEGKEVREFNGVKHVLEMAIPADFALIRAHKADRYGNLTYRGPSTFNATMAGAARVTIAEVDEIVPLGDLDPHHIGTPGVYVQRVVKRPTIPAETWEDPR
jgi:3-oxoadipate CoA-transferase alpha subunit